MGIQNDLAVEILGLFPDAPTLTLARTLYTRNPAVYTNVEDARSAIRYCRGASGSNHLGQVGYGTHARDEAPLNPFPDLPEGLKHFTDWTPVVLEDRRTLVMSDLHIPYQDKAAVEIAVGYGKTMGVDAVLLLGDVHDMFSCSFWERDPRKRDFQREVDMGRTFYAWLRGQFPKAAIRVKIGNHEERYERYMAVKAPELLGVDSFEMPRVMHMAQHGIEVIGDKRIVKIGKLHLVHGHEFGRSVFSPVNPARGLYLRGKENALAGHWHATSDHTEKSMGEKVIRCWSLGAMCDLHPDWLPINKWNLGFAVVEYLGTSGFRVENCTIIDGRVY